MEEFLRILLAEVEREVHDDEGLFSPSIQNFCGTEVTVRKFVDSPEGKCSNCLLFPSVREQKFLSIKINVPESNDSIKLSYLIANYYSESTDQMMLRCGSCCTHSSDCPQTGVCKSQNAVTQLRMGRSPMVVQLMRFRNIGNIKIKTNVVSDKVLQLPNLEKYELITISNHVGPTISAGHYVTCTNLHGLTWTLCDDASISAISDAAINDPNNYIYVYQRLPSAFIPKTFWQEVQPGQAVLPDCTVRMDASTGKQFAKIYDDPIKQSFPNIKQNRKQNVRKPVATEEAQPKLSKDVSPKTYSQKDKKKKVQTGDFQKELKECERCRIFFEDLSLHLCMEIQNTRCLADLPKHKESEEVGDLTNVVCKGCSKVFKRLLVHLNSKNGSNCKLLYSVEELEKPNKWKVYYEKNKEKKRNYQKQNAERIKGTKRRHYEENAESIKTSMKRHYEENAETIKKKLKLMIITLNNQLKQTKRSIILRIKKPF